MIRTLYVVRFLKVLETGTLLKTIKTYLYLIVHILLKHFTFSIFIVGLLKYTMLKNHVFFSTVLKNEDVLNWSGHVLLEMVASLSNSTSSFFAMFCSGEGV